MPRTASSQLFDPAQEALVRPYLERIVQSDPFQKAPNLRHLLEYLVAKSNEGHTDHLKESVIAIEVFGRRPSFDGRVDNIVRVQAHRLRKLLDDYYADAGKNDKLRVTVPRGGYVPQFIILPEKGESPAVEAEPDTQLDAPVQEHRRRKIILQAAILAAVFAAGALLSYLFLFLLREKPARPDPAVAEIWRGIFEPGVKVIVSYTNPVFLRVGGSRTYLLYQGPLSAPSGTQMHIGDSDPGLDPRYTASGKPLLFSDGWTGTGEVLGVHRLTEMGAQFGQSIRVIPSRALALDEAHSANVIFLGSPWFNGILAQIGNDTMPMYNTNDGRIMIRQPQRGEQAEYVNAKDPVTSEIRSCFALFSVLPGLSSPRKVISSAGIGTWATWGGVDFLTGGAGASQVAKALLAINSGKLPEFYQAIIRTEMIKGSLSNESLVAVRVVQPSAPLRR